VYVFVILSWISFISSLILLVPLLFGVLDPIISNGPDTWALFGSNIPGWMAIIVSVILSMITIWRTGVSNRRHIEAVSKASADQIIEARYWRDLKRKQELKLLIQELEHNIDLYQKLVEGAEKGNYKGRYFNFNLIAIEKCLADTPVDVEVINLHLLNIYFMIKTHDNNIIATRTADLSEESRKTFIENTATEYKTIQKLMPDVIEMIKKYEQNIELNPPPELDH
jgi:hypothetical protein